MGGTELFKLIGKVVIDNQDANNSLDDTTTKASTAGTKIVNGLKKVGGVLATAFATEKIIGFGKSCVESAAEVKAMNSQYEQTFGDMQNTATKAINKVADSSGILETRLKGTATSIYAFAKSSGADSAEAMSLMETALQATADSAAYYDKSLEESGETLKSFLKGNFANDAALGVSCTEFTRNAKATELFGKKYNELSEIQKQQTLLKMVTDSQELSGAMGQAAREADGWENVMGNLKESWKQFQAVVGAPILEAIVPVVKNISSGMADFATKTKEAIETGKQKFEEIRAVVVDKFSPAFDKVKEAGEKVKGAFATLIDIFSGFLPPIDENVTAMSLFESACTNVSNAVSFVADAVGTLSQFITEHKTLIETLVIIVGSFAAAYTLVTTAMGIYQGICAAVTAVQLALNIAMTANPIGIIIVAIGALIAIGVLLWKNWDKIKEKCAEMFGIVKEKFNAMKEAVSGKIQEMKDAWNNSKFGQACNKAFAGVKEVVTKAMGAAVATAKEKLGNMKQAYEENGGGIKGVAAAAWEGIKGYYTAGFSFIDNLTGGKLTEIKDKFTNKMSEIGTTVSSKFEEIKNTMSTIMGAAKEEIGTRLGAIKSAYDEHGGGIQGAVAATMETVKQKYKAGYDIVNTLTKGKLGEVLTEFQAKGAEIWSNVQTSFENIRTTIVTKFNQVKDFITTTWELIKTIFTSVLSAIWSTVTTKFEDIRTTIVNKLNQAKDTVTSIFESIRAAIAEKINAAKDAVGEAIEKIKSFFNFEWKLPELKLPHIKIDGEWNLKEGTFPSFGVEWYKNGGVMMQPTAFGINPKTGNTMVGGEAGAEAVAPIDVLQGYVRDAVAGQNAELIAVLNLILKAIYGMDEGLGNKLYNALLNMQFRINDREFARLVRAVN